MGKPEILFSESDCERRLARKDHAEEQLEPNLGIVIWCTPPVSVVSPVASDWPRTEHTLTEVKHRG